MSRWCERSHGVAYRSTWSGSITFGMISVPVKAYTAQSDKDIAFHMSHASDGSRLQMKRWCPVDDREVLADEIQRVYEVSKGFEIPITDTDLADLPVPSKKIVDLLGFVALEDIDPAYIQKSYWLEPETVGLKPYQLLKRVMRVKGVVGLGKIAMRNKEQLCILRPYNGHLMMETLYWPDEVRLSEMPELPDVAATDTEIAMADQIIEAGRMAWAPTQYHDEFRVQFLEMVERKKAGLPPEERPAAAPAPTTDLMVALRATLDQLKATQEASAAPQNDK